MKKTIKISAALLLMVLTGTATLSAKEISNSTSSFESVNPVNDKEKKNSKEAEENRAGAPYFRYAGNQVSMNLLNLDRNPVHVQILDKRNRVLFTEVIKGENTIGKQFDFSDVSDGIYTIIIKDCENQFIKKVEKY
ncbi:hypothetical protein [Robertkochia marina]|nr:hypothetical protein [Robertkochia marina]TRZ46656.1 hypothetical protein D3A96_03560 [Robertkochia marina]